MRKLLTRYREQVSYLFFGVLTTLVNYGVFWLLDKLWAGRYVLLNNAITFLLATAFAYVTNKRFVFRSPDWSARNLLREGASFLGARLFSFGVEEAGLALASYVLHLDRFVIGPIDGVFLAKVLLSVLAVILNYFFSKFLVFSQKKQKGDKA